MPKVRRPAPIGPPEQGGDQDGRKAVKRSRKSPCGRPPAIPTGVRVSFHVKEAKNELEYSTIVRWNEVTDDIHGFPVRSARYYVQLRPTDQDGVPKRWSETNDAAWEEWTEASGAPGESARQLIHKRTVDKPKDADPDDWGHVSFGATVRPKTWYYQARVRAEDTEGCKGDWSAWSEPRNALQVGASNPSPPIPTGIALSFSSIERERWDRYIAIVDMNEVGHWDVPGGDDQDDVAFYACQLQGGQGVEGPWDGKIRTLVRAARDGDADTTTGFVFTSKIKKHRWYRARARTIDRFNRRGAWSEWTTGGSPTDTTDPPLPLDVEAYGRHNHVGIDWRKPDHPSDSELPHPDIAYAQVQLASSSSFSASTILKFDKMVSGSRKEWETRHYRRRYWLRARHIDGSDNKGAWVQAGPVRPQRVGGQRVVVGSSSTAPDIDYGSLASDIGNRARRSGSAIAHATLEGEATYGTLQMQLQLGRTAGQVSVGALMCYVNASNHLIVRLRENASSIDGLQVITVSGGSENVRVDTTGSFAVRASQVYDLQVTMTSSGAISIYLDGVQRASYTLTSGERANIVGTRHGIFFGSDDSGTSRIEEVSFTPTGETVPTFDDGFERTGTSSGLGIADSGQTWTIHTGGMAISADAIPSALNNDLWATVQTDQFNNIVVLNSGVRKVGESGSESGGLLLTIDRPTRFLAMGSSHMLNTEGTSRKGFFFLVCVNVTTGETFQGKAGRAWLEANDGSNDRPRLLTTQHDRFIDCPAGQTRTLRWWWGYRVGGPENVTCHIGPQAMTLSWRDAYDMVDRPGGLTRPAFGRSGDLLDFYRRTSGNE